MAALTSERLTNFNGLTPARRTIPMRASAKVWKGGMVATDIAGLAMAAGLASGGSFRCRGIAQATADNSSGAASAIKCEVQEGVYTLVNHATDTITIADIGNDCFVADDQTVARTSAGGTRIVAGRIEAVDTDGVRVDFYDRSLNAEYTAGLFKARCVMTSLQAYTGTGTATLTETANGAWATQDGVTNVVGDVVFIQEGTTNLVGALDAGPWQISDLGSASTKWVLKRPNWWAHGSGIVQGAIIEVGGEGTAWAGSSWKTFVATGKIVGTDAAVFWVREFTQAVTLVTGFVTVTNVGIRSTTKSQITFLPTNFNGASSTVSYRSGAYASGGAATVAGVLGTGSASITALVAAGTFNTSDVGTGLLTIINW